MAIFLLMFMVRPDILFIGLAKFIFLPLNVIFLIFSPLSIFTTLIHEAGHLLFLPFGTFLIHAGGSITEVLFPLLLVILFLYRQAYFTATVFLYWVSIGLHSAAQYIGQAQSVIPEGVMLWTPAGIAITETPIHGDWTWALLEINAIGRTFSIAAKVEYASKAVLLLAIILTFVIAVRSFESDTDSEAKYKKINRKAKLIANMSTSDIQKK